MTTTIHHPGFGRSYTLSAEEYAALTRCKDLAQYFRPGDAGHPSQDWREWERTVSAMNRTDDFRRAEIAADRARRVERAERWTADLHAARRALGHRHAAAELALRLRGAIIALCTRRHGREAVPSLADALVEIAPAELRVLVPMEAEREIAGLRRRRALAKPAGTGLRSMDDIRGILRRRRQAETERDLATGRYGYKYPREGWDRVRWHGDRRAAETVIIQNIHQPGYTSEPYVQLICQGERRTFVVAELEPRTRQWLHPLVAAGFLPRSIG